jgi:hypothetical protein
MAIWRQGVVKQGVCAEAGGSPRNELIAGAQPHLLFEKAARLKAAEEGLNARCRCLPSVHVVPGP